MNSVERHSENQKRLGNGLGLASLALGGSEFLMPETVAEVSGLDEKYIPVLKAFGIREMVSGFGLLASKNKTPWLWSRVIGDVIDGAFLGWAYANEQDEEKRKKIVLAFTAISPIVLADIAAVVNAARIKNA